MNKEIENIKEQLVKDFRKKFGQFYVSVKPDNTPSIIDLEGVIEKHLSLIADEVLKIIKPKIESIYKNLCLYHCAEHKLLKKEIKELLSNLSPNKENKNNE